jgi:hypothetical protein
MQHLLIRFMRIGSNTHYNSEYRFIEIFQRKTMNKTTFLTLVLIICVLLSGCAGSKTSGASEAVQAYFQAITAGDADGVAGVSCPDWQETARGEVASFAGVKTKLDQLSCQVETIKDNEAMVSCSGAIIATYVDQDMRFDLSGRRYRVVQQDAQWLVCGYDK